MSGGCYVRAVGAVTAAGVGVDRLRAALADTGYSPPLGLERGDASDLPVAMCATFNPRDHLAPLVARRLDRPARLLAVAAREALATLGEPAPWSGDRIAVTAGTWNAGTTALVEVLRAVLEASPAEAPPAQFPSTVVNAPASQLAILERLSGPNVTFFEKQAGGLRAVAEAPRMLRRGRCDAVLACGVDEAQWLNAEGYERLGTLRGEDREGMCLAEGAAVLVLADERGEAPLARLAGVGSWAVPTTTYLYPSTPEPLVHACRQALVAAEVDPADVDLVVAAANGLPVLETLELKALTALFGDHRPAVLAPTVRLGEGALAGSVRALIAVLALDGSTDLAWPPTSRLAEAGYPAPGDPPHAALVYALAGGGSAVAAVLTAP